MCDDRQVHFHNAGSEKVSLLYCTIVEDPCHCDTFTSWIDCETATLKGTKNWTYGVVILPPNRTVIHTMCTDHLMIVCVKNMDNVDDASIDDFNVVLNPDAPLFLHLVAVSGEAFNPVTVRIKGASPPPEVGSRGLKAGMKKASSEFLNAAARGFGGLVAELVYDELEDPISEMIA
ncbi:hypothetical protein HDU81_008637, partial [Chytriomyces hyalinus]